MTKHISILLAAACLLCLWTPPAAVSGSEFIAIAYHDVVNHRHELTYDAITLDNLIDHFEWIRDSGLQPVTIDDLQAARAGTRPLPDKAILLCWDDAYTSFYTLVLPLLKAYNYPAVLALVGSWMAPGPDEMVQYGDEQVPRRKFMTWQQVKEAADSGLVEIASHSYNLHTTVLADQSGDLLPAAVAHVYDPATSTYETKQQYRQRIRKDLQASSDLMQQHLGLRPRVLVWPFGRYNEVAREISGETGMDITLTLNPVAGDTDRLGAIGRLYPTRNPDLMTMRTYLESWARPPVIRFFRVDSSNLLEPTPGEEHRFSSFLDRVKDLDPNMVVFEPVVEDGGRRRALFANSRYPVAQDRLSRLSWHTSKRAGAGVFLWLSSPLFQPGSGESAATVNRFFSDMGKSAPGEGLVLDTPELIAPLLQLAESGSYREAGVRSLNPDRQRSNRQAMGRADSPPRLSAPFKALESFQQWQPFQEVGLVLSMERFRTMEPRQFKVLLTFFDFLIIDIQQNSVQDLRNSLGRQLASLNSAGYLQKCAFLFSTAKGKDLSRELQGLPALNIINWGYQFDRFLEGVPASDAIRPVLSKRAFPYPLREE